VNSAPSLGKKRSKSYEKIGRGPMVPVGGHEKSLEARWVVFGCLRTWKSGPDGLFDAIGKRFTRSGLSIQEGPRKM